MNYSGKHFTLKPKQPYVNRPSDQLVRSSNKGHTGKCETGGFWEIGFKMQSIPAQPA